MYSSGNDQEILNDIGQDHWFFSILLIKFKWTYDYYMVDAESGLIRAKKLDDDGLPIGTLHDLNMVGALGLVLMWYRTRSASTCNLTMIFG